MTTSKKSIIEYRYKPTDFFEEPVELDLMGILILVSNGIVRGQITLSANENPHDVRNELRTIIVDLFNAHGMQTGHTSELFESKMELVHADDRKDTQIAVTPARIVISGGHIDVVVRKADGKTIYDSREERIQAHTKFLSKVMSLQYDAVVSKMLRSFRAAQTDPGNRFIHLYEIREILIEEYVGESNAKGALDVSTANWKRFGKLANEKTMLEGRHRGQSIELTPATMSDVEWAMNFAEGLIKKYVTAKSDSRT